MSDTISAGAALRAVLAGAWRAPVGGTSQEIVAAALPLLLAGGVHGLAWRQVAGGHDDAFRSLRQAYRQTAVAQVVHESRLQAVLTALHRAGVATLLLKGWSVARLYPGAGARPCGDIDLAVRPDQMKLAGEVLRRLPATTAADVDLHSGVADLDDRTWDDVCRCRRLVSLGDTEIPILGAEDQLRHLCLHLMRHGAFRPLWLCDVAVAAETRPAAFDWNYCLHGELRLSEWVLCAFDLARQLLDARIDEPATHFTASPWIVQCVLHDWNAGTTGDSHMRASLPITHYWRHPGRFLGALRDRWPNPIEAAFKMKASPRTRVPILWHQLRYAATRALRLPAKLRRGSARQAPAFQIHEKEAA